MSVNTAGMTAAIETYSSYGVKSAGKTGKKPSEYGKTIGEPTLSEEGKKYYEELKKKFGNMEFILVSEDMKDQAKAHAASFANPLKTVVLINEDKVERMATDEAYRKEYEGIISGATANLSQMKESIESSGANVKGYGIQVNDNGMTSYFAVLQDASDAQKARIEKKAEEKKAAEKKAEKKAEKEAAQERLKDKDTDKAVKSKDKDTVTITASSIEELMEKISEYTMMRRSDNVQTEAELQVGQNFDFQV